MGSGRGGRVGRVEGSNEKESLGEGCGGVEREWKGVRRKAVNTFIQLDSLDCPWWCPNVRWGLSEGMELSL